jgi:hypothetical protein
VIEVIWNLSIASRRSSILLICFYILSYIFGKRYFSSLLANEMNSSLDAAIYMMSAIYDYNNIF